MSILNVNQIQPVGGGNTITVSASDVSAPGVTITASSFVGTATTAQGLIGTPDITIRNIQSGIVTATTFSGSVTGNLTGTASTATASATAYSLTGSPSITVTNINASGIITTTGDIDANGSLDVDGHTELDNLNVSGVSTFSSTITTGNVGIQTNDITRNDLVGAGNSFVGMYIGDGFLAFSTSLNRPNGYYITTSINALNAGPVTLGSTMTLDGTWVIV
jgi:hypothetical protein